MALEAWYEMVVPPDMATPVRIDRKGARWIITGKCYKCGTPFTLKPSVPFTHAHQFDNMVVTCNGCRNSAPIQAR